MKHLVIIEFKTEDEALDFARAIRKVAERGNTALYNAIMCSALNKAEAIRTEKEGV